MSLHDHSEALNDTLNLAREMLEAEGFHVQAIRPTGSAYYGAENPGDFDVLVLVCGSANELAPDENLVGQVISAVARHGFEDCVYTAQEGDLAYDGEEYGDVWAAVRRGRANIVLTRSPEWYIRAAAATELIRHTSVTDDRVPPKSSIVEVFHICRFED